MGIFREFEFTYNGDLVTATPNMKIMQRIERDVSIMSATISRMKGDFKATDAASVLVPFLAASGVKATHEDVLHRGMATTEGVQEVITALDACLEAMSPEEKTGKKPEGQPEEPSK